MLLESLVENVSPASLLASVCWQVLAGGAFLQTLPLSFFSSCSFCFIYFALNYLFSFWLRWVFMVFSSCREQGAALSVLRAGFFLTTGCRRTVLSSWAYSLIAPIAPGRRAGAPPVWKLTRSSQYRLASTRRQPGSSLLRSGHWAPNLGPK